MTSPLRVAFLPDSFHEVNGVAHTARQFAGFARRNQLPMLVVHSGPERQLTQTGTVWDLQLPRGPVSFDLDSDLRFDLLFLRHLRLIADTMRKFKPDVIHITGPSDVGIAGAMLAHELKIPLAASWHTNLHEYAARRWAQLFARWSWHTKSSHWIEKATFDVTARYYRLGRVLFAPNQELVDQLEAATNKPCFQMSRGVDTELFDPMRRSRSNEAETIQIGYVGRLTAEKNVRLLREVESSLLATGIQNFRMVFIGQGSQEQWLRENIRHAEMKGVLRGEALATAYADMDIFAFPSSTDTFGNVVLEAQASGVPAVVTSGGGPKFLVNSGVSGFVTEDDSAFVNAVRLLVEEADVRRRMSIAAREQAQRMSWDAAFNDVYNAYDNFKDKKVGSGQAISAATIGAAQV
jgi:phosphatidylinositol alpha 1,6-mannosyltransferase